MRASGILLPVSGLPGKYGIGCFSEEAYRFVDFLKAAHQAYWQILPLGPTGYGDSPYQSFSTFAGNPYFISLENLIRQGLLTEAECDAVAFGDAADSVDYEKLYAGRYGLLRKAYERSRVSEKEAFQRFCEENSYWLRDYAMFMAIKDQFDGVSFVSWPEDIRRREQHAVEHYRCKLHDQIVFYEYLQYEFYRQWFALKAYANENGVHIIGDIPIYVAYDSADVWAHPELFQMDENRRAKAVSGCPPDGFSAAGQLWGNPLYDWKENRRQGYDWWIRRMEQCAQLYDVVRIDHFRGFDAYYSIDAGEKDATSGHWERGPGMELFRAIRLRLGDIRIIAEDLGYVTDSVRALVRESGFPNMKVLEFAFDSRGSSDPADYLPYNYEKNCVVYTGTHDNETLVGWLSDIRAEELEQIQAYIGRRIADRKTLAAELIRMAQASVADLCIIPLQDYLGLGNEARMNTPSTLGGNWKWRVRKTQIDGALTQKIKEVTTLYGR